MKKKLNIIFFNEGSFLPILSGGDYFKYSFLKYLNRFTNLIVVNSTRNYVQDKRCMDKLDLKIVHIPPLKFYADIPYLASFVNDKDIIIFNDAINLLQIGVKLKQIKPLLRIGFEAHNINHQLSSELKHPKDRILYEKQVEQQALLYADFIFVRSQKDQKDLTKLDLRFKKKVFIGKSGICDDEVENCYDKYKWHKKILFLGHLNYAPNKGAIPHIINTIAPRVYRFDPTIEFLIAGSGFDSYHLPRNVNIRFLGYVKRLNLLLKNIDLALCPVFEGSGTRIKILDYLSKGIPTITTSKGIEGLEKNIKKAVIQEDNINNYSNIIINIYKKKNKKELCNYSQKGILYIRQHRVWSKIIQTYIRVLEGL